MGNRSRLAQKLKKMKQENPFHLPPEISFTKDQMSDGTFSYNFRHQTLGSLGRILIQPSTIPGQSHIISEIAGDPDDPMTQKRLEIFRPIAIDMTDRMAEIAGVGIDVPPPPPPYNPKDLVPSQLLQCEQCDGFYAHLVFADYTKDVSELEDMARKMFAKIKELNLPTWIIGPPIGVGDHRYLPSDILKVWPNREAVRRLTPDEFNPELDALARSHCQ